MSSKSVQIIGGDDRQHAWVDSRHNAVVSMDEIHAMIHKGGLYSSSASAVILSAGVAEYLVRVVGGAHMRFTGSVAHNMVAHLFEGPTTTADGTPLATINRNRFSSNTADTLIFAGPTVTVDGTELVDFFIPGGGKNTASGGQGNSFEEWVLSPGDYLMRISNTLISPAAAGYAGIALDFYE